MIKKPPVLEKQTPNFISAFDDFVKHGGDKAKSAPKPKLYTSGPKVPVIGSPYRPSFEDSPTTFSKVKSDTINITPGVEDLVSKVIESKINLEKVQAREPKPIPKNTTTYKIVSKLVTDPTTYKNLYQNLTRKPKIVETITPISATTSNAILLSNSTVRTATTQADQRSQQLQQRAQFVSHLNIKQCVPKPAPAPAPHTSILNQYYADKTTAFLDKNGRMLAFADTIVQTTAPKTIYMTTTQKPCLY